MGPLTEAEQNRLIIECGGLVEPIAAAYRGRKGIPFEDLVAQGHLGLVLAARMWERRARFATYATHKIHSAILDFIRDWQEFTAEKEAEVERDWHEWQIWPHVAPFENWTALAASPEQLLIRYEEISGDNAALSAALLAFPARDREILLARFVKHKTLDSIARQHKISLAKVVRILNKMLRQMAETIKKIEQRRVAVA